MKVMKSPMRESDEIVVAADLEHSSFGEANKVYGSGGVIPTLKARDYKDPYKVMTEERMGSDKPITQGSLNLYGFGQADNVWSENGVSPTILAYNQGQIGHQIQIVDERCLVVGNLNVKGMNEMTSRVHAVDGISPSVRTFCGGNQETKIMEEKEIKPEVLGGIGEKKSNNGTQFYEQDRIYDAEKVATAIPAEPAFHPNYGGKRLRIRKLTPSECMRLMGFESKDTKACYEAGLSNSNVYHQSGDSIVSSCLMALMGQMLGLDWKEAIERYADKLAEEE